MVALAVVVPPLPLPATTTDLPGIFFFLKSPLLIPDWLYACSYIAVYGVSVRPFCVPRQPHPSYSQYSCLVGSVSCLSSLVVLGTWLTCASARAFSTGWVDHRYGADISVAVRLQVGHPIPGGVHKEQVSGEICTRNNFWGGCTCAGRSSSRGP